MPVFLGSDVADFFSALFVVTRMEPAWLCVMGSGRGGEKYCCDCPGDSCAYTGLGLYGTDWG